MGRVELTVFFDESHIILLIGLFISSEIFYFNWLRGFYYVCKQVH